MEKKPSEIENVDELMPQRPEGLKEKSNPTRSVMLGFVNYAGEGHTRVQSNQDYGIVPAGSAEVEKLPKPTTRQQLLDINTVGFFTGDLPEGIFGGRNEGLLKIKAHTGVPQDNSGREAIASWVKEFDADDDTYAPGFLHAAVFRNVLISGLANLSFDLYEMDKDASEYYDRFKSVLDRVPEIRGLDVLKGMPYLSLATNLFNGVVEVFGENSDDHIWGEIPIMEINPLGAGAFLRDGIYVLIETERKNTKTSFEDLRYRNEKIVSRSGVKLGAHLIFSLRLLPYR